MVDELVAKKLVEVEFVFVELVEFKFVKFPVVAFAVTALLVVALVVEALETAKLEVVPHNVVIVARSEFSKLANRFEEFKLVILEEAAVVVEKVEVPEPLITPEIEPEMFKLVIVALVKVALVLFKLEIFPVNTFEVEALDVEAIASITSLDVALDVPPPSVPHSKSLVVEL